MKPKFEHDCSKCQYLGTGKYNRLECDFYVCQESNPFKTRTFIARFGNEGPDYSSNALFCCVALTSLDKFALYYGLDLTDTEKERLFQLLLNEVKYNLPLSFYTELTGENEESFRLGTSNHFGET